MEQASGMTLSVALCGVGGNSRPGIRLERSPFELGVFAVCISNAPPAGPFARSPVERS